ncbi:Vacuolar protein sorting-associated protein 13C [Operophtera brumata]|uniref:Vacuolar protein sorting-associated protein 13C n=1 Tax=Operophtera brumata TaxID=104452 RepID=A0A0L7KJE8_OPEBR|nr:Vacuolar protein sorting-associated protein 13C [Operophtera brumata]
MLGIYLCKLRSGEPNRRLASIFGMPRQTLQLKIQQTRHCLENDFLPRHLGFDHITRDEIIARNRILPNNIFGTPDQTRAIIILDGTYLFVQKSSNFLFLTMSYSLHKYTNLIKPFMIVCGDGYIVEVTGPYNTRTSDAKILRQILDNHTDDMEEAPIRWFLETDDVMVLDRGFRDALTYAEECGFTVCTPQSLGRHERQLSTIAANKSRLVTLVRWVVETINGRLKRDFKVFRHRYFNNTLPNAIVDFRIAAALINATQESYSDSRLTESFSDMIERNVNRPNLLADYVDEQRINAQRNISFRRIEAALDVVADFPRMTFDELLFSLLEHTTLNWQDLTGTNILEKPVSIQWRYTDIPEESISMTRKVIRYYGAESNPGTSLQKNIIVMYYIIATQSPNTAVTAYMVDAHWAVVPMLFQ